MSSSATVWPSSSLRAWSMDFAQSRQLNLCSEDDMRYRPLGMEEYPILGPLASAYPQDTSYPSCLSDQDTLPSSDQGKPRMSKEQVDYLELAFEKEYKPSTSKKKEIARRLDTSLEKINVSPPKLVTGGAVLQHAAEQTLVQNWFQNRRAKSKQEARKLEAARDVLSAQFAGNGQACADQSRPGAQEDSGQQPGFYCRVDSADASAHDGSPQTQTMFLPLHDLSPLDDQDYPKDSPPCSPSFCDPAFFQQMTKTMHERGSHASRDDDNSRGRRSVDSDASSGEMGAEGSESGQQTSDMLADSGSLTHTKPPCSGVLSMDAFGQNRSDRADYATPPAANPVTEALHNTVDPSMFSHTGLDDFVGFNPDISGFDPNGFLPDASQYPVQTSQPAPPLSANDSCSSFESLTTPNYDTQNEFAGWNFDMNGRWFSQVQESPSLPTGQASSLSQSSCATARHGQQHSDPSTDSGESSQMRDNEFINTGLFMPYMARPVSEQQSMTMNPDSRPVLEVSRLPLYDSTTTHEAASGVRNGFAAFQGPSKGVQAMEIQPMPRPANAFKQPKAIDLAARRQRPRPAALGGFSTTPGAHRSMSYNGPVKPSPSDAGLTPDHNLRRIKSTAITTGRVQKPISASAQRSPLSATFSEHPGSPALLDFFTNEVPPHVSLPLRSSHLAPPTPASTAWSSSEQQTNATNANLIHGPGWNGVSPAHITFASQASPPFTPVPANLTQSRNKYVPNTFYMGPRSAPAWQQSFNLASSPTPAQVRPEMYPQLSSEYPNTAQNAPSFGSPDFMRRPSAPGVMQPPNFSRINPDVFPPPYHLPVRAASMNPPLSQPYISPMPIRSPSNASQQAPPGFQSTGPSPSTTSASPVVDPDFYVHEYTPPGEKSKATPRLKFDTKPKVWQFTEYVPSGR